MQITQKMVDDRYAIKLPKVRVCRKRLGKIYPRDISKYKLMADQQILRIYESVLLKGLLDLWHIPRTMKPRS